MKKGELSYEEAISRLERIVADVENGQMNIDDLVRKLKEAKELVEFCKRKLTVVNEEVKRILDEGKEGDEADK